MYRNVILILVVYRPGFVRLNLPYFMNTAELDYIISAVAMISEHGWKMLPLVSEWERNPRPNAHVFRISGLQHALFKEMLCLLLSIFVLG